MRSSVRCSRVDRLMNCLKSPKDPRWKKRTVKICFANLERLIFSNEIQEAYYDEVSGTSVN